MCPQSLPELVTALAAAGAFVDIDDAVACHGLGIAFEAISDHPEADDAIRETASAAAQCLAAALAGDVPADLASRLDAFIHRLEELNADREGESPAMAAVLAQFSLPPPTAVPSPLIAPEDVAAAMDACRKLASATPPPLPRLTLAERTERMLAALDACRTHDLPSLAALHDEIEAMLRRRELTASTAAALRSAAEQVEDLLLGDATGTAEQLESLRETLRHLDLPPRRMTLSPPPAPMAPPRERGFGEETADLHFGNTDDLFAKADRSLLPDFVSESLEHLGAVEQLLLGLESQPRDGERLAAVFRAFHTIKGVAGFLGLAGIQRLAHETETLLDGWRKGELDGGRTVIDTVFRAIDALKTMIGSGRFPAGDQGLRELVHDLHQLRRDGRAAEAPTHPPPPYRADETAEMENEAAPGVPVRATLKVDARRLDKLLIVIDELAVAEAAVAQALAADGDPRTAGQRQTEVTRLTRDLQQLGMALCMVPMRATFRKMARLVHDLAGQLRKPARFLSYGGDTELDKTIVDRLDELLLHMVRNALDHGVEDDAAERRAVGKPPTATVELRASHRDDRICIVVRDDGRGLDRDAIRRQAHRLGLVDDDRRMTDADLLQLIFAPGFSTRQTATDVSGRGVGMDVVKRHVEALNGMIEVHSTPGQGTTFTLWLPLTMAIVAGTIVRAGQKRYVIPSSAIVRTTPLPPAGSQVLGADGSPLPLLWLGPRTDASALAIVAAHDGQQVALVADELLGQEQIVLRGRGHTHRDGVVHRGSAILPDGQLGLIVDLAELLNAPVAVSP